MKSLDIKAVKPWGMAFVVLLLLGSCGGGGGSSGSAVNASAASDIFVASLTGAQEVPPTASNARGTGSATVDPVTHVLTASVTASGMIGTAAHIHLGAVGVSGPIIFPLTETPAGSGVWQTQVALTDAQLSALIAGNYYVNVHSTAFPNGEIRGQLVAQAQTAQPATGTPASGSMTTPSTPATTPAATTTTPAAPVTVPSGY